MIKKEPMNLYRILSVVALILVTYSYCCLLCFVSHLSADEWLCVLTVATIVLLVFIFELEFERLKGDWLIIPRVILPGLLFFTPFALCLPLECVICRSSADR